jgi:hypothetical protein
VARSRRIVGLITLLAVVVIAIGVSGVEPPGPRLGAGGGPEPAAVPGVQAVGANTLFRVGAGAPPDGELGFVAVEPSGNVIVTDVQRHSVLRFDSSGHLIGEWGPRLGEVTLGEPAGVAVRGDSIYVVDRQPPRVLRLSADGQLKDTIDLASLGTYGLNGLAMDAQGTLFVADTGRNRLLVFGPDGQFQRALGRPGSEVGAFTQPMMLAFGPDGAMYVADWENGRVERFTDAFEVTDAWSTGARPFGVAVDQLGRVFVPDPDHRRIQVFNPRGVLLTELGGPGSPPLEVAPRQVALARPDGQSVYALGQAGLVRLDLENTPPPVQSSSGIDLLSLAVLVLVGAFLLIVVLTRWGRRASVGAPLDRKIGVQPEDRGQRQREQPGGDQNLVVAHQPERKE